MFRLNSPVRSKGGQRSEQSLVEMGQLGENLPKPSFCFLHRTAWAHAMLQSLRGLPGTDIHPDLSGLSGAVVGTVRQITAAGKDEGSAWLQYKPSLPLGQTTTAAQWQRPALAGLLYFAKAEQRLARWSGRGIAKRLGGVKLTNCLNPIACISSRSW